MRIFVFGGTGFVGNTIVRHLIERGHSVRLLVHKRKTSLFSGDIRLVQGDVNDPAAYAEELSDCDAAINLIGIIREFPSRGVTFEKLHVQATRNILHAVRQAGVKRYLHMSALGVRPHAQSMYHRSKFIAEQDVRGAGLHHTIFQPSVIFGPGDEFINMLAHLVKSVPVVPVIGDGKYRLQPVFVGEVAHCFAQALEMPETIDNTYPICGTDRLTYNELLDLVGRVLGKDHVTKVHVPLAIIRPIVPLLQKVPSFPITSDQLSMLLEENICESNCREAFRLSDTHTETILMTYLK